MVDVAQKESAASVDSNESQKMKSVYSGFAIFASFLYEYSEDAQVKNPEKTDYAASCLMVLKIFLILNEEGAELADDLGQPNCAIIDENGALVKVREDSGV